jgi:diguanylate cyclase (GGDEF)-like protein/putative nucleotidyltransferase with HDIG domain
MATTDSMIIVVHQNAVVRSRLALALTARRLPHLCVDRWSDVERQTDPLQIGAVLLQVSPATDPDTIETLTRVRRRLANSRLIIIGDGRDAHTMQAALRFGVTSLIEEPFSDGELDRRLDKVLAGVVAGPRSPTRPSAGNRDGLTPLPGHSAFLDALSALRNSCRRQGNPLSLMMLDLDRFHDCNDHHSPTFGDQVLKWFARTLERVCRQSDPVARYQADRFIVALPNTGAARAADLARRCRQSMSHEPMVLQGRPYELTVSVGIVESTAGFIETEQQLIQRARIALEQAKDEGGNRTVTWTGLLDAQPRRRRLEGLSLQSVSHRIERIHQQLRYTYVESTRALVAAVEAKDPYTREHSLSVSSYAEAIGKRMKLPASMLETLRAAALLHDMGKIGVPDAILTKPGPLTPEEWGVIRKHPQTGLEILGHVSFLAEERPLILHHHERYDGQGYPGGLCGDRIPIGARVLAVADALDAMFSPRSYKQAYDLDRVRAELAAGAGRQFDPAVAEATLEWLQDAPNISRTFQLTPDA